MKKTIKIIGIAFIFLIFSSLFFNIIYAVPKDEVIIINSGKETGGESGGWVYENLNTRARGNTFSSMSKCEDYRKNNKLTTSTTDCYSVYKLLAPIGKFTEAPKNIGDYFNTIFLIAIGLCGALAVIMIVIGGVQYMGNESIFGKTEAKSQITKAIFGLLIALGSYALLNTINPDLLGGKGVNIKQVSAEIEEENITTVGTGANVNGIIVKITPGAAANCVGGIVNIPSSMGSGQICQSLLTKLIALKKRTDTIGVGWKITSSIRGEGTISSCHLSGNPTSGNCADIVIINGDYSNLCVAIAQVGGLNFANEAKNTGYCQSIQPYKIYPTTTGPHLHVNFIG